MLWSGHLYNTMLDGVLYCLWFCFSCVLTWRLRSLCMYVCMVITYSRVWINRVRLPILLVVSWTVKIIFPCPRARLRIWSRETGSAVPSRVSLLIPILRLNLVLTYGIPYNTVDPIPWRSSVVAASDPMPRMSRRVLICTTYDNISLFLWFCTYPGWQ